MSFELNFPINYIPLPDRSGANGLGDLWIGSPNSDPKTNVVDRVSVYVVRQNDTPLPIGQPIELSAGGVPLYNGSPVQLEVDGAYCMQIVDRLGAQIYYAPYAGKLGEQVNGISVSVSNLTSIISQLRNGITSFAALGTTPSVGAGQLIYLTQHTSGGVGGGQFKSFTGTVISDGVTQINSSTPGLYWKRINFVDYTSAMGGAIGGTDATAAIRKVIDACAAAGGGTVKLVDDYLIDGNANPNVFIYGGIVMKPFVTLDLNGHDLTLITTTNANYAIINGYQTTDFKVIGPGKMLGDVVNHVGAVGEFGHGLWLAESKRVVVRDLIVGNCWGDGIYISEENGVDALKASDIVIDNVISDSNRRQGISITAGKNIRVSNSKFTNTGAIKATAPAAGLDIEPQVAGVSAEDITFTNCTFDNNSLGVVLDTAFPNNIRNVQFINCHLSNSTQAGYFNDLVGANVKDIKFIGGQIDNGVYGAANTEFTNVKITKASGSTSSYALTETIRTTGISVVGGEIRSIGSANRLYFGIAGKTAIARSMFTNVNFVLESGANGPNTVMVTNSPTDFHSCNFLTEGTVPTGNFGFDFTDGHLGLSASFFTGHNYFDSTWHSGVSYLVGDYLMSAVHIQSETNASTLTPNAGIGDIYELTVVNGSAIVIPTVRNQHRKIMRFVVRNTFGVMGAITWPANFKISTWTNPANGFSRNLTVYYNGTNWIQVDMSTVDVLN